MILKNFKGDIMETLLEMEENLLALSTDILKIEMQLGEAKYLSLIHI